MNNKTMSTLNIGNNSYEIKDAFARQKIAEMDNTTTEMEDKMEDYQSALIALNGRLGDLENDIYNINLCPLSQASTPNGYVNKATGSFGTLESGKTYTFSAFTYTESNKILNVRLYTSDTEYVGIGTLGTGTTPKRVKITLTPSADGVLNFSGNLGKAYDPFFSEIMLEEGETDGQTYEPYGQTIKTPVWDEHFSTLNEKVTSAEENIRNNSAAIASLQSDGFFSVSMFERIGVIGDSFASGYITKEDGIDKSQALYNLSWGKVISRRNGINVENYSAAGLSTRTWLENQYGLSKLLSNPQDGLYLMCLGINDTGISNYLGTIADITADYHNNPDTFYGNYARIVEQTLEHSPQAKIIFVIPAISTSGAIKAAIKEIANHYNVPYITLKDDAFFNSEFWAAQLNTTSWHPTAIGYSGMALAIERLISKCVQDNVSYFRTYTFISD